MHWGDCRDTNLTVIVRNSVKAERLNRGIIADSFREDCSHSLWPPALPWSSGAIIDTSHRRGTVAGLGEVASFLIALLQRNINEEDTFQSGWPSSSTLNECVRWAKSIGRLISRKGRHFGACIHEKVFFIFQTWFKRQKISSLEHGREVFKFDRKKTGE